MFIFAIKTGKDKMGMVAETCNLSTWEDWHQMFKVNLGFNLRLLHWVDSKKKLKLVEVQV